MFGLANLPLLFAQAASDDTVAGLGLSTGAQAIIIFGVIAASFGLGHLLAQRLRMPDYSFKLGLVLASLFGAIAVDILLWPPKLGIDLSGGAVLVYEVDQNQLQEANRGQLLDQLNRQLGTADGEPITARLNADHQIEIPLPSDTAVAKVERTLERLNEKGLGIKRVAERQVDGKPVLVYESERHEKNVDMDKLIGAIGKRINPSGVKEVTVRQYGAQQIEIIVPEREQREIDLIKRIISTSGNLQFRILASTHESDDKDIIELAQQTESDEVYQGAKLKARWVDMLPNVNPLDAVLRPGKDGKPQVLILIDDYNVTGDNLVNASAGVDERANLCIKFNLDARGGIRFGQLTSENLPSKANSRLTHQLGIVLDNVLQSSAAIQSTITDSGQITGSFNEDYVNFVVNVLNSGSLPAALQKEPISETKISAQLGDDTIRSGENAMLISTIAVVTFMLFYYRFAGLVADVAVVMNMILAVALMLIIKAAFTLPGLAGLVLTVGMAVDANVLIYERMREEAARGASLRMTIRNGFSRAMATIIDSNLTTVSTAVVLFVIGTDQIKGFAVSLILGLVVSLYTAVFVARVIFDVFERQRWLTRLHMRQFIGETHIDFVRWRGPAIAASLVVIAIGLVAVVARGRGLLDIDFNGGTSINVQFKQDKPQQIADIRETVSNLPDWDDVAVSSVGTDDTQFKIETSQRDMAKVQADLKQTFGDKLATYTMSFSDVAPAAPKSSSKATGPGKSLGNEKTPATQEPATKQPISKEPAAEKPASESPTGDEKSAQPASDKQGAADRRFAESALALAGSDDTTLQGLLLAQAATAPAGQDEAPASGAKEPTVEAAQPAADEATPAADKTPAEPTAAAEGEPGTKTAAPIFMEAKLHFGEPINRDTLARLIDEHLQAAKFGSAKFDLSNPSYKAGDNHGYHDWKLSINLSVADTELVLKSVQAKLSDTPVFPSSSQIGGKVAGKTQWLAVYALLASLVIIVLYVWVRFQSIMFGLAAVLALIHDVLVTVGFLGLSYYLAPYFGFALVDPFKISLAVVAALLTIVGYSINDTIVIFDRIREIRGKNPDLTEKMINDSVNQTLGRTLLTSGTVLIGTLILYFVGGPGIHPFAYAMLVGLISGTYSTVYIASPVLLWLKKPEAGASVPANVQRSPAH